jgi:cation-transporting ATPase 13A2
MLYPKPIGFKFYRDSIRFIGVMAMIAALGFCVSSIQFIRLGASSFNAHPARELNNVM